MKAHPASAVATASEAGGNFTDARIGCLIGTWNPRPKTACHSPGVDMARIGFGIRKPKDAIDLCPDSSFLAVYRMDSLELVVFLMHVIVGGLKPMPEL